MQYAAAHGSAPWVTKMTMRTFRKATLLLLALCPVGMAPHVSEGEPPHAQSAGAQTAPGEAAVVLLTPAQLESLLPATVYFRGKTASIQLRNAAGARFGPEGYVLVAIVDTSGYASSVQETYQAYFITERAVAIGSQRVSPGTYGAGIAHGKFILMDVGGHSLLQADAALDQAMRRPRPLQLLIAPDGGLKLYFGRSWIAVSAAATQ